MKSCILTVGTEILFGQILNTNAKFLSEELNNLGHDVMYHKVVGDNRERLLKNLKEAFSDCDLVITTGGLGPTQDDLTKETVAEYFHDKLQIHEPSMNMLKNSFKTMSIEMTENNLKQAYLPESAQALRNPGGTAPGFFIEKERKMIISLPGPPSEMKAMFLAGAKPVLESKSHDRIYYTFVNTFGIGESSLETKLLPLINGQTDPTIATYASEGQCYLRVASKRPTIEEAESAVEKMLEKINNLIGDYVYSTRGEPIEKVLLDIMLTKNLTLSAAESCTGGGFAATFVGQKGASGVLDRSLVTYSNEAKVHELGVSEETLKEFGAVSKETALEMVRGIKAKSGSDISVSVTGIAGPEGGTPEKPVGLVYIGIVAFGKERVKEYKFNNRGREYIRKRSILTMFNEILRSINGEM